VRLYFDDHEPITAAMVHVGMLLIDHGVVPPDSHLTRTDLSQITGLSEQRLGKLIVFYITCIDVFGQAGACCPAKGGPACPGQVMKCGGGVWRWG
jgi:hypothetical protein